MSDVTLELEELRHKRKGLEFSGVSEILPRRSPASRKIWGKVKGMEFLFCFKANQPFGSSIADTILNE